ncbi:MAG: hypothetical protein ACI9T9_001408 [Oleiphilaceae bacterium]
MKHFCKYHPISPAMWLCKTCQTSYDKTCMPDANEKKKQGICPNCQHDLHYLKQRQAAPPFWHILPQFFLFPCNKEPLLILTISGLLSLTFLGHYLLALAASICIIELVTRYGYQIIKKKDFTLTAPPGLSEVLSFRHFNKSLLVSVFIGLALLTPILTAQYTNLLLATFLGWLAFWLLPAVILVRFRQSKFDNTLKINTLLEPMIRMKWAYFGLVCGIIIAFITSLILVDFSQQHLQKVFTPIVSAVTFSYFNLVLFSVLAYILHAHQSFSTISPSPSSKKSSRANQVNAINEVDQIKRVDADIDIALKQGNYSQLVTRLEKELNRQSFSDLRRDQLYKLLCALNDHQRLEKYAHSFLAVMLGRGKIDEAAQFIHARREHNTEFMLYDLALSKRLADAFHEHQEYQLVVWLAFKANTRFKPEPELAELYLRAAKTLLAKLRDKHKASEYLSYIIAHYPNQPATASAKILQKLIHKQYPND